jgi:hypothetical protein
MDNSIIEKTFQRSLNKLLTHNDYQLIERSLDIHVNPKYITNSEYPLYGFYLRTKFMNVEAIHFVARSFVLFFEEYSFLDEKEHISNYAKVIKLFTGNKLDVTDKIIWKHNYVHGNHLDAIRQLYYVFYMMMYEGIIAFDKDHYEKKKHLKSIIIKKIINAFKLADSDFPDYSAIDSSIRPVDDKESEEKNGMHKIILSLYPKEIDFEKLTIAFIKINISNMEPIF